MGGTLGGVRGYFDSAAERTKAFNDKSDRVNKQIDLWEQSYENSAAGVIGSNMKWAGLDILQYGLLFGGLGRTAGFNIGAVMKNVRPQKIKFSTNVRTLAASLTQKVLPNLPAAGLYASLEGLTEGFQEVYQEWAKYANTQEAKGLEYDYWIVTGKRLMF